MRFEPEADKVIFAGGVYKFVVTKSEDGVSKTGNDYLHLILKIRRDNQETIVHDYILAKHVYKLKMFLQSIDRMDLYEKGNVIPSEIYNCSGEAMFGIENDAKYGDKMVVREYIKSLKEFDDAIPF